jgi:hypothetical protein
MNGRLTLISGKEPLVLGPADGQETLARATDVFKYIDSNFEHWSCDVAGPATKETPVQVFEMVRDSTFQEMFGVLACHSIVSLLPKRKLRNS